MSSPQRNAPKPVQHPITANVVIEVILPALSKRQKVLVYSMPGLSTSQLLLEIEAAFPNQSRGAHYHRPATRSQANLSTPDLRELDALLVNNLSLPAFEHHRAHMAGDKLGIVAGLSGVTSRDRALLQWALFFDGAPDLIIEIASRDVFFDVTLTFGGVAQ